MYTQFSGFASTSKPIEVLECGINADVGANAAQDMRNSANHRLNQVPFVAGFDGKITQIILSSRSTNDYSVEFIINGTVEATYSRDNDSLSQIIEPNSPIEVEKEDLVRVRFSSGTGTTQRPFVKFTIKAK